MRNIFRVVSDNRRDILRIIVQTVSAVAATYSLMSWIGSPHTSWAVIGALMTIGLSADSSY